MFIDDEIYLLLSNEIKLHSYECWNQTQIIVYSSPVISGTIWWLESFQGKRRDLELTEYIIACGKSVEEA